MPELVTFFQPQPAPHDLPGRMPSPFASPPPHPLARRAAEELQEQLRAGRPLPPAAFEGTNRGKMFAVLVVVASDGRVGYLRGFSGMMGASWLVPGFAGPLFDSARRDQWWPAGEAELRELDGRMEALAGGPRAAALAAARSQMAAAQAVEVAALGAEQAIRRVRRRAERLALAGAARKPERAAGAGPAPGGDAGVAGPERAAGAGPAPDGEAGAAGPERLRALALESQQDETVKRRLRAAHRQQRELLVSLAGALEQERALLKRRQTERSHALTEALFDGYHLPSAAGPPRPLRALFAPDLPPGGAGDCAAPKLFGEALRRGLRPLALAEFWWGTPPVTGGRLPGVYYPSCRRKCGPVLGHMLQGLAVEPAPVHGGEALPADQPRVVFEDRWLVVVDKPAGLLSVPGRGGLLRDSVLTRLRARYPQASGPLVVHRLDLDTSGLLLAAKDSDTHRALQAQFLERTVGKRYIAWLEGEVAGEAGLVELALRVDLDDRPRQIHDPVHGKPAATEWRVLERADGRTRVALFPRTGRSHQLRVHAAHPAGLGAPILGDRLYGRSAAGAPRLLLHAEALSFVHPHTGQQLELAAPAPF